MHSFGLVLLLVFVTVFAERRVKIGFVVGPESSRRESSDKFWSFGRPPSSQLLLEPLTYRLPRWGGREIGNAVCDAALKGARGLIVLCPPRLSSVADSYSSNLRLPLVTPKGGGGGLHTALLPDTSQAAAALLRDASSFAFLYDTDTGADQLSSIMSLLQQKGDEEGARGGRSPPWVEGFWRVHGINDSLSFLRSVPDQVNRAVMAVSSEKLADDVFAGLGVSRAMHGIFLGTTMVSSVRGASVGRSTLTKFSVSSVGGVTKEDLENRWKTLEDWRGDEKDMPPSAVLSHDAIRVMYGMLEQLGTDWMDSNPTTLDVDCFNYTAGLPEGETIDMHAISGSGVTGSLKFGEDGKRTNFTLDIIETNNYGPKMIGTWSNSSGLQLNPDRKQTAKAERQTRDPPIRVTSIEVRPFLQKGESGGGYEGFVIDLIDELRRVTGRSFQLHLVADGKYGLQVDGRWVGMIGELVDNVTDIVIAPLTKTPKRATAVNFGKTFMQVGIAIILSKPDSHDHLQTTLGPLSPLSVWSPWQWAVVVVLLLVTSALGYAASRFVGVPDRVRALESNGKDGLSPCGSLWFSCGALLIRDTGIYPRSLTHRLLSISWWFLCIVLAIFYVSSLTAEVVRTRTTLTTTYASQTSQQVLEDLLQKGSPVIGTIKSGSTPSFFRNSQVGLYREYGRYIDSRPEVLTNSYSEGIRRVREEKGKYAFLAESTSAQYEVNQPPCDILLSSGYLATRSYATATRLDNPILRDVVDDGILNLMENGVLRQLYEKWWHNFTDYCEDPNKDILPKVYSSSLTLHEASGVFIVLVLGAVVSACAALVENYVASKRVTFLE